LFSVSVPVLSVQMTVVSPSVSTDDNRRTSALRFAIRCVASASESVTVGSIPFGTTDTVTPIAKTKRSCKQTQPGRRPQQQLQRLDEVGDQPPHRRGSLGLRDLVRALLGEPAPRVLAREAGDRLGGALGRRVRHAPILRATRLSRPHMTLVMCSSDVEGDAGDDDLR
jgi:hypothetical protein